ncbi:MAG: 23S rRNA (guanosine(2251)-2'-O)-methyltransferase RlmB [Mycoplasmoidaceae bacterium]|nr:MAG: 23S rRNA (guanosine(2251)-2'-O)-methyltransferase RlmB [Mycoplasmoidaceae bacterium]
MILFGKKSLIENINNVEKVELSSSRLELVNLLKENKIPYSIKPDSYFNKFENINHQKVVSYTKPTKHLNILDFLKTDKEKSIFVVLDSIMDPGNFGAILRTCESFGVDGIVYKKDNQAQINETVSKTSQGAVNRLNMFRVTNLSQTLELLKKSGYWIYTSALNDKAQNYSKINYDNKTVLVIGNEENGVNKNIITNSDFVITIPMIGTSQSLNVSVATGILLAQIVKQFNN